MRTRNFINEHIVALFLLGLVCFIASIVWFEYYRYGLKVRVYARQGIEVSRWELFMGAEPSPQMKVKP